MIRLKYSNSWYPFVLILLVACIKPVKDKNLPEPVEKLVVAGFISPEDTIIEVRVGKTLDQGDMRSMMVNDPISDATVIISGNGSGIELPYNERTESYWVPAEQFQITPGETYTLVVSAPGGYATVEGETTIPEKKDTEMYLEYDTVYTEPHPGYPQKEYIVKVRWKDHIGGADYYRLIGQIKDISTGYYSTDTSTYYVRFTEYQDEFAIEKSIGSEGSIIGPLSGTYYSAGDTSTVSIMSLWLLTVDFHYYKYHETITSTFQASSPFTEPMNVYTNLKGGIGVFASYRKYIFEEEI